MKNRCFGLVRLVLNKTMETNSPYFSPRKTRNFTTQQQRVTLLQKVTHSTKSTEHNKPDTKPSRASKTKAEIGSKLTADETVKEASKGRKRNIRSDAVLVSKETTASSVKKSQSRNEKTPTKQEPVEASLLPSRDIKQEPLEVGSSKAEVQIKVEPIDELQLLNEKTPCKRETIEDRSPVKRELDDESTDAKTGKEIKWEPENWRQTIENIRAMRRANPAPVDTMGCDQFASDVENFFPDRVKRYHCLVSLMLSSQTKDQVNHECMLRLKKHGLTPETIVATDAAVLEKLIYPVSFYKNKTKFIQKVSQLLIDQYDGDIPNSIEGLLKLPGVGKKMAHLCMGAAWNIVTGIGVDTHVHRISNWLQWVPKETKTPEDTRQALEKWLPFELWEEVNHMMVGFGQTICTSTYPRCNDCSNAPICPARGKHGIRKTPIKKEIKPEDLEF